MRYIGSGSLLSIIYYFLKFLEWYDISLIHPHTQGIIEISLKPPKTHILYKKREFPHKEYKKTPPHYKKETIKVLSPR